MSENSNFLVFLFKLHGVVEMFPFCNVRFFSVKSLAFDVKQNLILNVKHNCENSDDSL